MATIPPVTLVLDVSALSAATPREWLEFSRVGNCIVPQVVYEEMKFLYDRSPDPDLERIARAFNRFYATSGWKISDAHAHHPILKTTAEQALTKRARVSLAVGRCAYATCQGLPGNLIVLVSSDRSMLQRIYDIQANNLCAITGQALLQWCRTGQRPIAVSQKLQQLRITTGIGTNSEIISSYKPTSPSRITSNSATRTNLQTKTRLQKASSTPDWLPQFISFTLSIVGLLVAAWLFWGLLNNGGLLDEFREPFRPDQQSSLN